MMMEHEILFMLARSQSQVMCITKNDDKRKDDKEFQQQKEIILKKLIAFGESQKKTDKINVSFTWISANTFFPTFSYIMKYPDKEDSWSKKKKAYLHLVDFVKNLDKINKDFIKEKLFSIYEQFKFEETQEFFNLFIEVYNFAKVTQNISIAAIDIYLSQKFKKKLAEITKLPTDMTQIIEDYTGGPSM